MALHRDIYWVGKQWAVTGFGGSMWALAISGGALTLTGEAAFRGGSG